MFLILFSFLYCFGSETLSKLNIEPWPEKGNPRVVSMKSPQQAMQSKGLGGVVGLVSVTFTRLSDFLDLQGM